MNSKDERRRQVREARKQLKEIKRNVPGKLPGSTIRKSFYGKTLAEAESAYRAYLNPTGMQGSTRSIEQILQLAPKGSVAAVLVTEYLPLKSSHRDTSKRDLQYTARIMLSTEIPGRGLFGNLPVRSVTAATIAALLDAVETKVTLRNPRAKDRAEKPEIWRPVSSRTVNKVRGMALELLHIAHEIDGRVRYINPKRVPIRKETIKEVAVYSAGEMRCLLEACRGRTSFVPVLLYGFLGLRLREGLGLDASALKANNDLVVSQQQRADNRFAVVTELKSENAYRTLPLPHGVAQELRPFTSAKGARIARSVDKLQKDGSLLIGNPINPVNLQASIDRAARRAGLRRLTHHELRHSFSSWLEENGCPRSVRLALMGQSRRAVDDRYNHATAEAMRTWLERLWTAGEQEWGKFCKSDTPEEPSASLGTKSPCRGESNGRSILTADQVCQIRKRLGKETDTSIAAEFGVSRFTIGAIKRGKIWKCK